MHNPWPKPVSVEDVIRSWKSSEEKPPRFILLGWCRVYTSSQQWHVSFIFSVLSADLSTSWLIFRRYSSFTALRNALQVEEPLASIPLLPSKLLPMQLEDLVFERGMALRNFLNCIEKDHPRLEENPIFQDFARFRANVIPFGAEPSQYRSWVSWQERMHLRNHNNPAVSKPLRKTSTFFSVFSRAARETLFSWTKSRSDPSSGSSLDTRALRRHPLAQWPVAIEAEFPLVPTKECNALGALRITKMLGSGNFAKVFECVTQRGTRPHTDCPSDCSDSDRSDGMAEENLAHQALWATEGSRFAVKVVDARKLQSDHSFQRVLLERNILRTVDHPFIVKYHGSFRTAEHLCIAMDCHRPLTLKDWVVARGGKLRSEAVRVIAAEACHALCHLHDHGVVMRDLKPDNMLLDTAGHIVISDFGLAKTGVTSPVAGAKSWCGTLEYIAPEVLLGKPYGCAVDFWAVGIVLYELLTGRVPFPVPWTEAPQSFASSVVHTSAALPSEHVPLWGDFISDLLRKSPQHRLCGQSAVLGHPFFRSMDWHALLRHGATSVITDGKECQ